MAAQADIRACIGRARRFAHALAGDGAAGDALLATALARQSEAAPVAGLRLPLLRGVIEAARAESDRRTVASDARMPRLAPFSPSETTEAGAASRQRVRDALAEMNQEEREVLLLVTLEGLTYAELAQTLGIPVEAAVSRLVKARQAFATLRSGRGVSGSFLRVVR